MTSNINYVSINENFPVAGQDNDTQVFRDNFDTIKTSLRNAKTEIESLQNATGGLQLTEIDEGSDFNDRYVSRAILSEVTDKVHNGNNPSATQDIDFGIGSYQVWRLTSNSSFTFKGFPTVNPPVPNRVGKLILELYGDGSERIITLLATGGSAIKKNGFPEIVSGDLAVTSATNPVFLEVWSHQSDTIFVKYLGQFS